MTSFAHIPHGHLTVGTTTDLGVIEQVSMTAYRIAGSWVPFTRIHGAYRAVEPMVDMIGERPYPVARYVRPVV